MGGVDHGLLNRKIVPDKIGWVTVISQDSSNPGRREDNVIWSFSFEKAASAAWITKVKFIRGAPNEIFVSSLLKAIPYFAPNHTTVTSNIYFCALITNFHIISFIILLFFFDLL